METMELNGEGKICLLSRNTVELTGVKKLDSFDSNEFLIDTKLGHVHVRGQNLALGTMDLEKGLLVIKGDRVDLIQYVGKTKEKSKEGFLSKIFK